MRTSTAGGEGAAGPPREVPPPFDSRAATLQPRRRAIGWGPAPRGGRHREGLGCPCRKDGRRAGLRDGHGSRAPPPEGGPCPEPRLPRHHLGRAPLLPARRRRSQRHGEPHRVAGPAGRSAPSRSGPWRRPSGAPRSPRSRGPAPGRGPPTAPSGRRRRPGSRRPTAGGHRRLRRDAPGRPPARRGRVGVRAGARARSGRRGRAATGGGPAPAVSAPSPEAGAPAGPAIPARRSVGGDATALASLEANGGHIRWLSPSCGPRGRRWHARAPADPRRRGPVGVAAKRHIAVQLGLGASPWGPSAARARRPGRPWKAVDAPRRAGAGPVTRPGASLPARSRPALRLPAGRPRPP